ncbi:MAG: saccharopine dehydrogenase family protein [Chitinophagaceae bacterium]|nr:MAG: saccharopine dehydrogenase family protein [Chitinophagaceae bacterium]
MTDILIIGAGKIGGAIAYLLHHSGRYNVTVADINNHNFPSLEQENIQTKVLDIENTIALESLIQNFKMVLNAGPFFINIKVATAAAKTKTHYFDLSEDVATTDFLKELAQTSTSSFMPQCGLAPGYISIVGYHLAKQFDSIESVKLRVGALPMYPTNTLKYNLTWSTDGLINEYCNPCDAIVEGKKIKVQPLEGYELFSLDGVEYEAFNTSGGLGSLAEVLDGKAQNIDYKTARYFSHRDILKTLLFDLGFKDNRAPLKKAFEDHLPFTAQDIVLTFVSVTGKIKDRLEQKIITKKIYNQNVGNKHFTAIQLTTASSACAVIDMHVNQQLPHQGFIKQEDVDYDNYIQNPFSKCYQ